MEMLCKQCFYFDGKNHICKKDNGYTHLLYKCYDGKPKAEYMNEISEKTKSVI